MFHSVASVTGFPSHSTYFLCYVSGFSQYVSSQDKLSAAPNCTYLTRPHYDVKLSQTGYVTYIFLQFICCLTTFCIHVQYIQYRWTGFHLHIKPSSSLQGFADLSLAFPAQTCIIYYNGCYIILYIINCTITLLSLFIILLKSYL